MLLGQDYWKIMLNVSTIYDEERQKCLENLKTVPWEYEQVRNSIKKLRCPNCYAELILAVDVHKKEDSDIYCKACGKTSTYKDMIGSSIATVVEESQTGLCPMCFYDFYSLIEKRCLACHYSLGYENCKICYEKLILDEIIFGGFYSHCA